MTEYVEESHTFREPEECAQKERSYKSDRSRFKSWAPRKTDKGVLVSVFCIEILRPGRTYDLPRSQAEKLIGIGYAEGV